MFVWGCLLLVVLPSILALDLDVEKQSSNEVMVIGLNEPAIFDLKITNLGEDNSMEFYNLVGFYMFPIEIIPIEKGEEKNIQLKILPIGEFTHRGFYTFNYFIQGKDGFDLEKSLTFRVIDLKDAFEIGAGEVSPETNSLEIYIHNKVNFNFENINARFNSAFFDFEEDFSLGPNKRKDFNIKLDNENSKKLMAGFYTLNAEITINDKTTDLEGTIKFVEKDLITTTTRDYGIFINTNIIKKENKGNVLVKSETLLKKNVVSRLFTYFSPEPDAFSRQGMIVHYSWNRDIMPGDSLEIIVKTNWLFLLVFILFVVVIVTLAKQYSKTNLVLRKRVSFVRAKGGEFALKISIFVNAKKYIENVSIIDRLPPLVKVHERFGGDLPKRINEKNKSVEWGFEKLEAGEIRRISYIIYSKVGVVGKFALPSTTAIYEREGEIEQSTSNRAFFVSEQKKIRE